ncbi:MAG: alpha/beta hydrolase [Saprospiraceae bacterium]|nr:alpha/beta hydrolase [Saprospiraceae bacterium]
MLLVLFWGTFQAKVLAQQAYQFLQDIPYYNTDDQAKDAYLKERCKLDIYQPSAKGFPTLVWFHGGGLTGGNKHIPAGLKEQGIAVVTVNYRLYPKIKAPVYIEDAAAAVAWTFKNIETYGGDPNQIFVSGHSAGGYLASMIGLDKSWLAKHDIDADKIAGLLPLSGHTITHFTVRKERGIDGKQPIIDELAPLYHVRADAPPLLLITGDRALELLGRYEENAYMMRMMKIAGHKETRILELDGYGHGMVAPAIPLVVKEIKAIIERNHR